MKKIFFAAIVLLTFFSSACNERDGLVQVRFQNNLTSALEEARMEFDEVNVTDLGMIPAGAMTDYQTFTYFEIGADMPMGFLKGKKDGIEFSAWSGLWCGTGVEFKQLEPGNYTIEINQVGTDSTGFFQLRFKD